MMKVGWISSCSWFLEQAQLQSADAIGGMMIGAHFFQLRLQEGAVVELSSLKRPGWYLWIDWVMVRRSKGWARLMYGPGTAPLRGQAQLLPFRGTSAQSNPSCSR